jgi:hypothetical protein
MKSTDIKRILKDYEFQPAGVILCRIRDKLPIPVFELSEEYQHSALFSSRELVYLWVHTINGRYKDIVYVGQTRKTLSQRCNQHRYGASPAPSGSNRGRANAQEIFKLTRSGVIKIYVRQSRKSSILGEKYISLCEAEERALIQQCRRYGASLWNGNATG